MNAKDYMDQTVLYHKDAEAVNAAEGVIRRVLSYDDHVMCVENTFQTGAVGALHSLVMHSHLAEGAQTVGLLGGFFLLGHQLGHGLHEQEHAEGDDEEVDDILDEGIIKVDDQKSEGRDQEKQQRRFFLIDHGIHGRTILCRRFLY